MLRAEIAPTAAEADVARVREFLADGHLHAAVTMVEKVLALAPRHTDFQKLRHDVAKAVVARAYAAQLAGDAAWKRRDVAGARTQWEDALELLENDRMLLARVERACARPEVDRGRNPA